MITSHTTRLPQLSLARIFPLIFVIILLLHAPLLRLPFFWDEAGFYVPAAYDLAHFHTLVPTTTIDTGHPPLSAAYLALWFTLSGWKPAVARVAMLLLAAFALTNVFLLARRLIGTGVAVATTIATAVYPIFFVQSSLAHADIAAAAFTLWGIRLYIERRVWPSQLAFCLAVLSKETAIITPLAFALWELLQARDECGRSRLQRTAIALGSRCSAAGLAGLPSSCHGKVFWQRRFLRVQRDPGAESAALSAGSGAAHLAALWHHEHAGPHCGHRGGNVLSAGQRRLRGAPAHRASVQLQFALIMLAHLAAFSLLGGALLTRYLLPAYPLVIMIGMSTLHRRIARWEWPAAVMVIVFVMALFFDPPYRIAPEDNLTYKDFVELHERAAKFLEQHEQNSTILTAWPATDELTRPYLGYVQQPFPLVRVQDFTVEEIFKARQMRSRVSGGVPVLDQV